MSTLEVILVFILGVFYVLLLVGLGFATLRNGRLFLFIVGIFLPLLWLVGALLPPTMTAQAHNASRAQQPPGQ